MKLFSFFLGFVIISVTSLSAVSLVRRESRVRIFQNPNDATGIEATVKGAVIELGVSEKPIGSEGAQAQERTKVNVRLHESGGILPGEELYIIDGRNLIIARLTVNSIGESRSFGPYLIGYGNFRRVRPDMRVCSVKAESDLYLAKRYKAAGDRDRSNGDTGSAIMQYEKSSGLKGNYPESHIELGMIYLEKKVVEYAMKEFDRAYANFSNIRDAEDRFRLLSGMTLTRYLMAYESVYTATANGAEFRRRFIKEGISYGERALRMKKTDAALNFQMARFLTDTETPDDKRAKDYLLRCVESEPEHADALVLLGRLYLKHGNRDRALEYVQLALKSDPAHAGARDLNAELVR